jgi:thymidine phosphorylase
MNQSHAHQLRVKDIGIDAYLEIIVYLRADSHVCKSEGFTAHARLLVEANGNRIIATLNVVQGDFLAPGKVGLSSAALGRLQVKDGDKVSISHHPPSVSFSKVRAKMNDEELNRADFDAILNDVVAGRFSNIELAAFLTTCAGHRLGLPEIVALTQAMISSGQRIVWDEPMIVDKHCIGGLPGNRTTPIVVGIVAAAGLTIPKTSSKAITSPAGTADVMETMTTVDLSVERIREVVGRVGGCLAWGGAVGLSPADDILIHIEKALDIDSEGQTIASVLSKKAAAGSTHVVIDIPVGPTAKVHTLEDAMKLKDRFNAVASTIGLEVEVVITDGTQPVGRGIGPALEAMDVLRVLRNEADAPDDLRDRALLLAAKVLECSGRFSKQDAVQIASEMLYSGKALAKFMAICEAQGGFKEPQTAEFKRGFTAVRSGTVAAVDNRNLARIAKLAGAPRSPAAGIQYEAPIGRIVRQGDLLFTIHASSQGELDYAMDFLGTLPNLIRIES